MSVRALRQGLHSESGEMLHLDLLRIIAAYAIVVFHFARFATGATGAVLAHAHTFKLAVDLFFIISGFVIAYVYTGKITNAAQYGTFLRRRFARLAPLHWLTLFFFAGLGLLALRGGVHTDHPQDYDFKCFAPNFLAIHAFNVCPGLSFNFVSWSISAEGAMYVIAPLILVASRKSALGVIAASALIIGYLFYISDALSPNARFPWYEWTTHFGVARALPEFMLGTALYQIRGTLARIPYPRIGLALAGAAFLIGAFFEWPMPLLLPIVYAIAILGIACDQSITKVDWLSRLGAAGQLTYSVYMLHPVLLTVLLSFVGQKMLHLHGLAANLWLLFVAILVFPVGYVSFVLFETPARLWISGSKARSHQKRPPVDATQKELVRQP